VIEPRDIGDIVSYDGTAIRWQRFGEGSPVVVANGIGVGYRGMALQLEHLAQRFELICWDYRGFFDSGPPGYGGPQMPAHARDLLAVMDALELDQAGFMGWSMGVSVGFEAWRAEHHRFTRMACIDGIPSSPFRASPLVPLATRVFPHALRAAAVTSPVVSPILSGLLRRSEFRSVAAYSGLLRRHAHPEAFAAMADGVAGHDLRLYLQTLSELGRQDAWSMLPDVDIPVLFLVGENDLFIPPDVVRRMARRAPQARVHVIPGASHFTVVEEPAELNAALEAFLGA
jgi:pimeloyl-ACP methyl ester carboxylesterase